MKISANNVAVEDAFTGVLSVVAMTIQNFAEGHIVADIGSAAVVLETDDFVRQCRRDSSGLRTSWCHR